eukprot:m.395670 g.395670  ORF g.395670 m.395670 type:complete len:987 (-) comp21104_c1_seq4:458-3418(-)
MASTMNTVRGITALFLVAYILPQTACGQPTFTTTAANLSATSTITWLSNTAGILIKQATPTELGAAYYTVDSGNSFQTFSDLMVRNITGLFLAPPSSRNSLQGTTSPSTAVLDGIITTDGHFLFKVTASDLPTITQINTADIANSVQIDPVDSNNILMYDDNAHTLSLSRNAGSSWNTILTGAYSGDPETVTGYSWGFPNIDPDHKIFAINQSASMITENDRVLRVSTDYGQTWSSDVSDVSVSHVRQFTINERFIAVVTDFGLRVSKTLPTPVGNSSRGYYRQATYPLDPDALSQRWEVVDASQGLIMTAVGFNNVTNGSDTSMVAQSNLYISGTDGLIYSESLTGILFDRMPNHFIQADVTQLPYVPGVYLASQHGSTSTSLADAVFYTMITFDKGSSWQRIPVPAGEASTCAADTGQTCSLHLHLNTVPLVTFTDGVSTLQGIVGAENAPGIAIATGNVGTQLSLDEGVLSVYVTQDGGATWQTISSDPAFYAFANRGTIIAYIRYSHPTHVKWSTDNGATFTSASIAGYASGAGELPYGLFASPSSYDPAMFFVSSVAVRRIDFRAITTQNCTAADYFQWRPPTSLALAAQCDLGVSPVYTRRNTTSVCIEVSGVALPPVSQHFCSCTPYDYECEYEYTRNATTGLCTTTYDLSQDDDGGSGGSGGGPFVEGPVAPWDCTPGGTWNYTPGYRKLPFDQCQGCAFTQCQPMPCSTTTTPRATVSTGTVPIVVVSTTVGTTTPANGSCLQFGNCGTDFLCVSRYIDGAAVSIPCPTPSPTTAPTQAPTRVPTTKTPTRAGETFAPTTRSPTARPTTRAPTLVVVGPGQSCTHGLSRDDTIYCMNGYVCSPAVAPSTTGVCIARTNAPVGQPASGIASPTPAPTSSPTAATTPASRAKSSGSSSSNTAGKAIIAIIVILIVLALGIFTYGKMVPESLVGQLLQTGKHRRLNTLYAPAAVNNDDYAAEQEFTNPAFGAELDDEELA